MITPNGSTGLRALDELGRRLEAAGAQRGSVRRKPPRRLATLGALGLMVFVAAPAIAVSGVLSGDERIEEALPQVARAAALEDPAATGRELRRLGFTVRWQLITDNPERGRSGASPTLGRDVAAPPPETEILSVLNAEGGNTATAGTRSLLIEVAPAGSAILGTHR